MVKNPGISKQYSNHYCSIVDVIVTAKVPFIFFPIYQACVCTQGKIRWADKECGQPADHSLPYE